MRTLWTRYEHGTQPVKIFPSGEFEYARKTFTHPKELLKTITGKENTRLSLDRYFRSKTQKEANSIFEIFFGKENEPKTGIDVTKKYGDIERIFYAGFGSEIARAGHDPEDVLQEIYKGILVRNKGRCPFDKKKSSFGHYVYMVCRCIVNNYHKKHQKRMQKEKAGLPENRNHPEVKPDTYQGAVENFLSFLAKKPLSEEDLRQMRVVTLHLSAGKTQEEISHEEQLSKSRLKSVVKLLRSYGQEYRGI